LRKVACATEDTGAVSDLEDAGFELVPGGGKGSHRKFVHPDYQGAVTLSGHDGDDAKKYQEKQVKRAIEDVEE
jgi:predicted RNA binding protein YcfA (HicA-like mRNA interferase family)